MTKKRILVINPNSTQAVTDGIDEALEPLRLAGGPAIDCTTLAAGPPAIETDIHIEQVVAPLCRLIESEQAEADAFVIACYSDPGLGVARARSTRPVFGMAESGMLLALTRGRRFGVISILTAAVERHLRYVVELGLEKRLAADLPVGLGVLELADEKRVFTRLEEVGTRLRDEHAADVVLLGCAGMARYRERLERALEVPVIDPTQAAVIVATGTVQLA